jgi:hypothetical protein
VSGLDETGTSVPTTAEAVSTIADVVRRLECVLATLDPRDANRYFCATYLRTTRAVGGALAAGRFEDAAWVERWDVAFASLYLDAIESAQAGRPPTAPWQVAFAAAAQQPDLPPLRHVLLGINAHINFDLPQALLAVISDDEFVDIAVRESRRRDHRVIDSVLASRVSAEDAVLSATGQPTLLDRLLTPVNRMATRRFLKEAREKVWANALALSHARGVSERRLAERVHELSELSAAKLEELVAPGQVLVKLAVAGFGVRLTPEQPPEQRGTDYARPPAPHRSFDPRRVGMLERDVWVAYYQRRWLRLLRLYVALVHAGFRMGPVATVVGAWHALRANQLWAPFPDNDPIGARRHMERFYRLLESRTGAQVGPQRAAELEIEWWRVHRSLQRDRAEDRSTEAELADALAQLYAHLYRVDPSQVQLAARERAAAMVLSDRWVAEGCSSDSPLLVGEGAGLVRSWAALLAAVHR